MSHSRYSPQRREDYVEHDRNRKARHVERKRARRGKDQQTGRKS